MKALFVSTMSGFPWGGSERLWTATAREALQLGWQVAISTYRWPVTPKPVADLIDRGGVWLPRPIPHEDSSRDEENYAALLDCKPDVICISQGSTYDFLGLDTFCDSIRRWAGPYVVLCRLNEDDLALDADQHRRAVSFLLSARHVGFAARRNMLTAERQLAARMSNASVIQSPVDLPSLSPIPWPAAAVPTFACVARLDLAYKGQDLLLECLASPVWAERPWQLRLYGEGPDRGRCEEMAARLGLGNRVIVAGYADNISEVWCHSHLLVLASRAEGTPQSLIESMICGRPSVCTDVGGVTEWLTEGESGFVVESASVSALSRGLERAWDAQNHWESIGQAANRFALAKLDRRPEKSLIGILAETA